MQSLLFPLLLSAAFVLTASGCRQTTGPIAGGPVATGTLSPVVPGQNPILGPFGGNTRVTPPSTGSYQPASGYIGASTAPPTTPGMAFSSVPSEFPPNGGDSPIGSGIQLADWTETNTASPNGAAQEPLSTYGTNPSSSDPRRGGMQVIDLTGAPPPPGYRPQYQPTQFAQLPLANTYGAPVALNPIPLATNSIVALPQTDWQPLDSSTPNVQRPLQPIVAPTLSPIQSFAPAVSPIPAPTTGQGPSTEPVNQSNPPSNLTWRRPGSQF